MVLCEPDFVSIVAITAPVAASTTCQAGPSSCGNIESFAIGRDGHAVAAAFVGFVPDGLAGDRVDGDHVVERGDIDAASLGTGGNAFYVFRLFAFRCLPCRDALHEFVAVIDIEDQDADTTVFHVVAGAGAGDVEIVLLSDGRQTGRDADGKCDSKKSGGGVQELHSGNLHNGTSGNIGHYMQ